MEMVIITKEHFKKLLELNRKVLEMTKSGYSNEMDSWAKKDLQDISFGLQDVCWRTKILNDELRSTMREAVEKAI